MSVSHGGSSWLRVVSAQFQSVVIDLGGAGRRVLIRTASRTCTHLVVHVCATAHLPIVLVIGASCGPALIISEREGASANTNLVAICEVMNLNKGNPVPYGIVPYRTVVLNLSIR